MALSYIVSQAVGARILRYDMVEGSEGGYGMVWYCGV